MLFAFLVLTTLKQFFDDFLSWKQESIQFNYYRKFSVNQNYPMKFKFAQLFKILDYNCFTEQSSTCTCNYLQTK